MMNDFFSGSTDKPTDKQIAQWMKVADINGDGKIDYDEFALFIKKLVAASKGKSDA